MIVICHQWFTRWGDKCAIYRPRRHENRKKMEKHFSQRKEVKGKWDENHRKCDNKTEIYELRLVIYLCANLLLQKAEGGERRVRLYYVTWKAKKFENLFPVCKCEWQTIGRTMAEKWKWWCVGWYKST